VSINRLSGLESDVGSTGVDDIQALAFPPNGTVPFAATGDRLGTVNTGTGAFSPVTGSTFGTTVNPTAITLDNVVALAWDSLKDQPAMLYAVHRRPSPALDIMFLVDHSTGIYVPNAFGANIDYVEIDGCEPDIAAIAFDPDSYLLYGISNDNGSGDQLVTIAPLDGDCDAVEDPLENSATAAPIDNMNGLTFSQPFHEPITGFLDSQLYGITGNTGDPNNDNKFWTVNYDPNADVWSAAEVSTLSVSSDYRALACPTGACDTLRLSKSHSGIGLSGSTVTFRILWSNVCIGQDFPSVSMTDALPSGFELITATSNAAAVSTSGNTVTLDAGTVRSGDKAGLAKVKARVTASGGSIVNQVALSDGFGKRVTASDTVQVRAARANLTLKLRGQTKTRPGRTMTYVARYRNATENNTLTMVLPADLGNPTSVFPAGAAIGDHVVTWQNLPAPTGLVKLRANVNPGAAVPGILTLTATMSDDSGAFDVRSQDTVITDPVVSKGPSIPSLSVAGPSHVRAGLLTQLSVRYRKINGSASVQVTLPPELTTVQLTIPEADSYVGGVLTWNSLPAPSGATKIIAFVSSSARAGGSLTVTASLADQSGFALEANDSMGVR